LLFSSEHPVEQEGNKNFPVPGRGTRQVKPPARDLGHHPLSPLPTGIFISEGSLHIGAHLTLLSTGGLLVFLNCLSNVDFINGTSS
jgi:hypothetical protein